MKTDLLKKRILGIDLGSTFFKAEVFDTALRSVGRGAVPLIYASHAAGRIELTADGVDSAFRGAVSAALESAGCTGADLAALAVTSQAQTFTLVDTQNHPRFPFVSWRDAGVSNDNPASALQDFGHHSSVGAFAPSLTVAQLAYLQKSTADAFVASTDRLAWLPTWFVYALTGHRVVDVNLAAMSGLYSLQCDAWWPEALACCGMTLSQLPELAALGALAGRTTAAAARYGLAPNIPVVLAGNDQTAGAYGAALHERDAILISLGTAQVAYACLPSLPSPEPSLMRGPYPGGRFYQLGADAFGAGTVDWARTVLPGCSGVKDFDAAATAAPLECHGVRFIADGLAGTGRWTGLENPVATVADQARAVLVTLVARVGDQLARFSPAVRDRPLLLCGGGAASAPWREEFIRQLGREITRIDDASPTLGAARMALDFLHSSSLAPNP